MEKDHLSFSISRGNRKVINFTTNTMPHIFYFKMAFEEKYPQYEACSC